MSKSSLVVVIGAGLVAGGLGLAVPASASEQVKPTSMVAAPAGVDHISWLDQIHSGASAPRVDDTVQHSR
jgi:hypothetical protein